MFRAFRPPVFSIRRRVAWWLRIIQLSHQFIPAAGARRSVPPGNHETHLLISSSICRMVRQPGTIELTY
jgi:hypothetical protein